MKLAVAQALFLNESFMLVSEIVVILKFFLGEDFEQLPVGLM
jgi:hypothetical protein